MSFILRAAVRPLVFAVFLAMAVPGITRADESYGGTDPPKCADRITVVSGVPDASEPSSFWAGLSALFAQWFAAMN